MDYDKLIERLRGYCQEWEAYRRDQYRHDLEDTATALSTLQAENEKLRAENSMLRKMQPVELDGEAAKSFTLALEVSELKADLARVTAELNDFRAQWDMYGGDVGITETYKELERVKVERDAYQGYFKDLLSKPDCNTCEKRSCEYRPRIGATVRVNCPLYSGPEKED